MDNQTKLFGSKNKSERIIELKEKYFGKYDKIISEFGNIYSPVLILGISPMVSHYLSESKTCFAFDVDLNQTSNSGGVLCRTFESLGIKIEDVLWDNIYKLPEDLMSDEDKNIAKEYMENLIDILQPSLIICLGNDCETVVNKLDKNVNIPVKKVYHPGAVVRGFFTFEEYLKNWERLNLGEMLNDKP